MGNVLLGALSTAPMSYDSSGVNPQVPSGANVIIREAVPPPPPSGSVSAGSGVVSSGSDVGESHIDTSPVETSPTSPTEYTKVDTNTGISSYLPLIGIGLLIFLALGKKKR